MNIIFLDVDGVLNSQQYFESIKHTKGFFHEIDKSKLPLLKRIVEENQAYIVLASTWRELDNEANMEAYTMYQYLQKSLADYGIRITSRTPELGKTRPEEIKTWLNKRVDKDTIKWISIEDDWDEKDYENAGLAGHLLHTEFYDKHSLAGGLQEYHVALAKDLFDKQSIH